MITLHALRATLTCLTPHSAAEHVTAVTVATKGKLDLSMAVAVGSSIQISLFVIPLLILLGWIIGQPLSLFFDPFEVLVLFVSMYEHRLPSIDALV